MSAREKATPAARASVPTTRPNCDGTTNAGSRNCSREATWQMKRPHDRGYVYGACPHHLHQVSTFLLGGERGDLNTRRILTEGS